MCSPNMGDIRTKSGVAIFWLIFSETRRNDVKEKNVDANKFMIYNILVFTRSHRPTLLPKSHRIQGSWAHNGMLIGFVVGRVHMHNKCP